MLGRSAAVSREAKPNAARTSKRVRMGTSGSRKTVALFNTTPAIPGKENSPPGVNSDSLTGAAPYPVRFPHADPTRRPADCRPGHRRRCPGPAQEAQGCRGQECRRGRREGEEGDEVTEGRGPGPEAEGDQVAPGGRGDRLRPG